jgi:hypothetical protein
MLVYLASRKKILEQVIQFACQCWQFPTKCLLDILKICIVDCFVMQVGYEGDGRQVWKVAINILTSSGGQPTRGVPSDCRMGGEANEACYEMVRGTP